MKLTSLIIFPSSLLRTPGELPPTNILKFPGSTTWSPFSNEINTSFEGL